MKKIVIHTQRREEQGNKSKWQEVNFKRKFGMVFFIEMVYCLIFFIAGYIIFKYEYND
jgi:hypothetical protein